MMKKIIFAALILSLALVGCSQTQPAKPQAPSSSPAVDRAVASSTAESVAESSTAESGMAGAQLPAPFTSYDDMQATHEAAEFPFPDPNMLPEGFEFSGGSVWNDQSMVQLQYTDGSHTLSYRVSQTLELDQMNGDYTKYDSQQTVTVRDINISCMGNGQTVSVAMWEVGGNRYCVMSTLALTTEQVAQLVETV